MSYEDLRGKRVLVSGAMRGIGREIALQLAKEGAELVFNYRQDEEKAKNFADELKANGAQKVWALKFDVTSEEEVRRVLENFVKEFGPISGLVNNAGISRDQLMLRLKMSDVDDILDTNLRGTILLMQVLTRSFMKAEDVSIVNISSIVGLMGNASQVAYAASKSGVIGATKSYAKELASRNIRCNVVCPGFIETDMTSELSEEAKKHYLTQIPLGRLGKASEVAQLVLFLLSKNSSYITGSVFKIDGGMYI